MNRSEVAYLGKRLRRLGFATYREYISSSRWQKRRKEYYEVHPCRCAICDGERKLLLHHRTYERLGYERNEDLIPLCNRCHDLVHHRLAPYGLSRMVRYLHALYQSDGYSGLAHAVENFPGVSRGRAGVKHKFVSQMSNVERAKYALEPTVQATSVAAWSHPRSHIADPKLLSH